MSGSRARLAQLYGQLANTYAELCRELGGTVDASGIGGQIATDRDLDSQWGDEVIKKIAKNWKGESFVNRRMSECSIEFLEYFADHNEWAAGEDDEKAAGNGPDSEKYAKYARYGRTRAARARGWAKRLRDGWTPPVRNDSPPPMGSSPSGGFDDSAPPSGGFADNPFGTETPAPSSDSDW